MDQFDPWHVVLRQIFIQFDPCQIVPRQVITPIFPPAFAISSRVGCLGVAGVFYFYIKKT